MLVSDVRSDKIGENVVDRFSISPLVLKISAFKVEELVIWWQPFWYANEGDMTSQPQDWKLIKYYFAYRFWNIERNSKKLHRLLGVIIQCILTSFNCCYSDRVRYRPFPIFDKYLHFFPHIVILTLQVFWTASLHLDYIFTFLKLVPHDPQ